MSDFQVSQFSEIEMLPDDGLWAGGLRVHPARDTRPWWGRVKLSPWRTKETVKGKVVNITGIKGSLEI